MTDRRQFSLRQVTKSTALTWSAAVNSNRWRNDSEPWFCDHLKQWRGYVHDLWSTVDWQTPSDHTHCRPTSVPPTVRPHTAHLVCLSANPSMKQHEHMAEYVGDAFSVAVRQFGTRCLTFCITRTLAKTAINVVFLRRTCFQHTEHPTH